MSADLINLRKARKARDRVAKEKQAGENRVKFGRTKAERQQAEASKDLTLRRLEAHKRATGNSDRNSGENPPPGDDEA